MMRLKALCKNIKYVHITHRAYLTNEFKNVLNKHLDIAMAAMPSKCYKQAKSDVDLFTNRLPSNNINKRNVCEQFTKLRLTTEGTNAFNLANHNIIKSFIDAERFEELSEIIKNRLYYRIFPDHYVGCYLINELLKLNKFTLATEISVQFILHEDLENELFTALSATSFHGYVKTIVQNPSTKNVTKKENAIPEKKVRVKYIRNTSINEVVCNSYKQTLIGKSMLILSENLPDPVKNNIKILGYVIAEMDAECINLLQSDLKNLNAHVLSLCESFLKDQKSMELLKHFQLYFNKSKNNNTLDNLESKLESLIAQASKTSERTLINKQINIYDKWSAECTNDIKKKVEIQERSIRMSSITNSLEDFYARNKKLHFFELQDNIDMEVFEKKKIYPRKWFGKKRKPKVVDDSYIPPEVTKRVEY